jgi:hypothetical protein
MPRRAKRIAYAALAVSYPQTAGVFGPFSGVVSFIAQMPIWDDPIRQRSRA